MTCTKALKWNGTFERPPTAAPMHKVLNHTVFKRVECHHEEAAAGVKEMLGRAESIAELLQLRTRRS